MCHGTLIVPVTLQNRPGCQSHYNSNVCQSHAMPSVGTSNSHDWIVQSQVVAVLFLLEKQTFIVYALITETLLCLSAVGVCYYLFFNCFFVSRYSYSLHLLTHTSVSSSESWYYVLLVVVTDVVDTFWYSTNVWIGENGKYELNNNVAIFNPEYIRLS